MVRTYKTSLYGFCMMAIIAHISVPSYAKKEEDFPISLGNVLGLVERVERFNLNCKTLNSRP